MRKLSRKSRLVRPKLIFVEGLPNAGKTMALTTTVSLLSESGVPAKAMYEVAMDNPLDNHCNAFVTDGDLRRLQTEYPDSSCALASLAEPFLDGSVIRYLRHRDKLPPALWNELAQYDFYRLPIHDHYRLVDEMWRQFLASVALDDQVYVIESAILQNPTQIALVRDNLPASDLQHRIDSIFGMVAETPCMLLYLAHDDMAGVLQEGHRRSPGWQNANLRFFTHQHAFGRARNLEGEEGLLWAYEYIDQVYRGILATMPCPTYVLDNTVYDEELLTGQIKRVLARHRLRG